MDADRRVELRFLGATEAVRAGQVLALGGLRQRGVLAVLAVQDGRVVPADELIEELWGGRPPRSALSTLRGYISHLRRVLEPQGRGAPPQLLVSEGAGYALRLPRHDVDTHRFDDLLGAATAAMGRGDPTATLDLVRDALRLWRGPAFADFRFEGFAEADIRRLEERRLEALELRIDAELSLGFHRGLVGELQGLVGRYPLRERLWCQLMLVLYRCERQADALAVYQRLRATLGEELGLDPGPEARRLEAAILRHEPELELPPTAPARSAAIAERPAGSTPGPAARAATVQPLPRLLAVQSRRPLVGRQEELARCLAAWDEALRDEPKLLAVVGPAGIGKTRLVAEMASRCHDAGARVVLVRCEDEVAPPYHAFRELLDVAGVPPVAGDLAAATEPEEVDRHRRAYFDTVTAGVARLAGNAPILLVVDDAQWADHDSLLLLRHLVRHMPGASFLAAVTLRRVTDAGNDRLLETLRRDDLLRVVEVTPLGLDDCRALLEAYARTGAGFPAAAQDELVRRSGGNPFFLQELAHATPTSDDSRPVVPPALRRVLDQRFDLLEAPADELVAQAAVMGDDVTLASLSAVAGPKALTHIDAATAAGILEPTPSGDGVRFAHALLREQALARMGTVGRRQAHHRAAVALERRSEGSAEAGRWAPQIAAHYASALPDGEPGRAAHWARRAAEDALARLAPAQAREWFEQADRLAVEWGPFDAMERHAVLHGLGRARAATGDADGARSAFLTAARTAMAAGKAEQAAESTLAYGGRWQVEGERDPALEELLYGTMDLLGERCDDMRARLLARLATYDYLAGSGDPTALAEDAVRLAEKSSDLAARAAALHALHLTHRESMGPVERLGIADDTIESASRVGNIELTQAGRVDRAADLLELGRVEETLAGLDWYRHAETDNTGAWWATAVEAAICTARGDLDGAERLGAEALAGCLAARPTHAEALGSMQRFALDWAAGRLRSLRPAVHAAAEARPRAPSWRAALAVVCSESGDPSGAAAHAGDAARLLRVGAPFATEWLTSVVLAAHAAYLSGQAVDLAGTYERLLPRAGQHLTVSDGLVLLGPADRTLGHLASLAGRRDVARRHLEDARRLAADAGLRRWVEAAERDMEQLARR